MLGNSLKVGDKAFLLIYSPNNIFHIQEVQIAPVQQTEGAFIEVIIKGKAISTDDETRYEVGKRKRFASNIIKSPEYVKNILKQYGRRLIKNIFERIF